MAQISVYWRVSGMRSDTGDHVGTPVVHLGILTDEHPAALDEPVIIEQESQRVYRHNDIPRDVEIYIDTPAESSSPIAERACDVGFRLVPADEDSGRRPQTSDDVDMT